MEIVRLGKREQKQSKVIQKELQDLHRGAETINRKLDKPDDKQPEDDSDPQIDRKALRWWERFDERHFARPRPQDYLQLKDITTSNRILQQSPLQPLPLQTYAAARLLPDYDLFADRTLIHVLFKTPRPLLASYDLDYVTPSYADPHREAPPSFPFRITPSSGELVGPLARLKEVKLSLVGYNQDEEVCAVVERYKAAMVELGACSEVERELELWERELLAVNKQNCAGWERLIRVMRAERHSEADTPQEIGSIREYLMWVTVLKYFEHGHSDKTMEMLNTLIENEKMNRPSKAKEPNSKKMFETDCKICFCSFNNDSNQVLYCDECNTSFHLACYGLQQIPKEDVYYCECCRFQKKELAKKMSCQLCCRSNFPVKQLEGHFYHVTCLILFNLARIRQGVLVLRQGITHQKILEMVVQSELQAQDCAFCVKSSSSVFGIRLVCSVAGCSWSAHPICAYLNGCRFQVRRDEKNQKLGVSYFCNNHWNDRDWLEQSYIRRYMCNLKGTSNQTLAQYREFYAQEAKGKIAHQIAWASRFDKRIIAKTKFLHRNMQQAEQRSHGANKMETESRRYLEKIIKRQH